jgi:transposase
MSAFPKTGQTRARTWRLKWSVLASDRSWEGDKEHAMPETAHSVVAVVGVDIGKNSFHVVGLDQRGTIVLRQ